MRALLLVACAALLVSCESIAPAQMGMEESVHECIQVCEDGSVASADYTVKRENSIYIISRRHASLGLSCVCVVKKRRD